MKLMKTPTDMNTFYTATLFSALSFSASRILNRWKATKENREQRRNNKLKEKALKLMSSKELLDNARKKDKENYEKAKNEEKE